MACLAVLNLQLDSLLLDIYTEKSVKLLSNISEQKHVFFKMQLQGLPSNFRTVGMISAQNCLRFYRFFAVLTGDSCGSILNSCFIPDHWRGFYLEQILGI